MKIFFNNKKIKIMLAIFLLLLLVDLVQQSYAKYTSSATATGNFAIAEWSFKINTQDVIANNNFSSTIVPVFDSNQYIASGVIAPTSTGYFDLVIDSSDVGVAFSEQISLSIPSTSPVQDIVFTGYKLNNGQTVSFLNSTPTITTNHSLNEAQTTNTYRFFIEWIDGDGETMDNQDDTETTSIGETSVKVDVTFIQVAN